MLMFDQSANSTFRTYLNFKNHHARKSKRKNFLQICLVFALLISIFYYVKFMYMRNDLNKFSKKLTLNSNKFENDFLNKFYSNKKLNSNVKLHHLPLNLNSSKNYPNPTLKQVKQKSHSKSKTNQVEDVFEHSETNNLSYEKKFKFQNQNSIHVNSSFKYTFRVLSSQSNIELRINDECILRTANITSNRGLHVIVLDQTNFNLMSHRTFDTYSSRTESELLNEFLSTKLAKNRLLIFAVQDEASFALSNSSIQLIQQIGCKLCSNLGWRDMYAMIGLNTDYNKLIFGEQISKSDNVRKWAKPAWLEIELDLNELQPFQSCQPSYEFLDEPLEVKQRRKFFCSNIEGYADSICNCEHPTQIIFKSEQISNNQLNNVPVVIIAANRPYYLYSMLNSLLAANGLNQSLLTIYIDGFYNEPVQLANLFGLRAVQHKPIGKGSARISQHYFFSLNDVFSFYNKSEFAIIFEEDLIVSPDIFSYFSQTKHLLQEDPSLYCVSAWNDQSYVHSSNDERQLYRVETMPGLGWMLSRELWINELKPNWPSAKLNWDWDLWMRQPKIRKNRECIIPDLSRTYHLGVKGMNMNKIFHQRYFEHRALNQHPEIYLTDVDKLIELNYELSVLDLIRNAKIVNENLKPKINFTYQKNPNLSNQFNEINLNSFTTINQTNNKNKIQENYLSNREQAICDLILNYFQNQFDLSINSNISQQLIDPKSSQKNKLETHLIYIDMQHDEDYKNWLKCANCFHLWDLDARGYHKNMWRFYINNYHVIVIGVPASPYSVLKKSHIQPVNF